MQTAVKLSTRIYDNAKSHLGLGFPEALPMAQAYVHIGMYLGWMIENDLCSEYFREEASSEIFRFKRREISCTILSQVWNGYLAADFFNPAGNSFTVFYYASGLYQHDYEMALGGGLPSTYHIRDTWSNYERLKKCISERYQEWRDIRNEKSHAGDDWRADKVNNY